MRYVKARVDEHNRDEAYRLFVTENLRLAPQQKYMRYNWVDFLKEINNPTLQKTCEEIVVDVMIKAGLKFGGDE